MLLLKLILLLTTTFHRMIGILVAKIVGIAATGYFLGLDKVGLTDKPLVFLAKVVRTLQLIHAILLGLKSTTFANTDIS